MPVEIQRQRRNLILKPGGIAQDSNGVGLSLKASVYSHVRVVMVRSGSGAFSAEFKFHEPAVRASTRSGGHRMIERETKPE